jgi:hypothetical protein
MFKFKSPWFFWYTGNYGIAITSIVLSSVIMFILLVIGAGISMWGVITAILLDAVGLWIAVVYFFALRDYLGNIDSNIHNTPLITHIERVCFKI